MITKQTLFTDAWNKMKAQGVPCVQSGPNGYHCVYEENGKNCAIGALMTPEELKLVDGVFGDVHDLERKQLLPKRFRRHVEFLAEIQFCHDFNSDGERALWLDRFQAMMKELAKKHKLEVPK